MEKTYEIEYWADTQGAADDLLRQATGQALHAFEGGRHGWEYTGPGREVFALRNLLVREGITHSVSAR